MRKTLLLALFLALSVLPAASAFAQTSGSQDPAAVVTAFVNASKARNFDLAMTYFASDAVITNKTAEAFGGAAETYSTPSAIRTQFVETAPPDLTVESMQASGDSVSVLARQATTADDQQHLPGVAYLEFNAVFTVVNGKIQAGTLDFSPATKATIQAVIAKGGGQGAPGMPTTGNPNQGAVPLALALLGVLLTGAGAALVRVRR